MVCRIESPRNARRSDGNDYSSLGPLLDAAEGFFPKGMSNHGLRYLMDQVMQENDSGKIELIFELVRRLMFPRRPSRFESFFGCREKSDLGRFAHEFRKDRISTGRIVYVRTNSVCFDGDMNLLRILPSGIETLTNACRYWSGGASQSPLWETIIPIEMEVVSIEESVV
jgi:hypothetical protein